MLASAGWLALAGVLDQWLADDHGLQPGGQTNGILYRLVMPAGFFGLLALGAIYQQADPVKDLGALRCWQTGLASALVWLACDRSLAVDKKWTWIKDAALVAVLGAFSIIVWSATPLDDSYYLKKAVPPTQQVQFVSDARDYDMAANMVLDGMGRYVNYYNRPVFINLMAVVKFFVGRATTDLMAGQLWIFSILPGLFYLIGAELGSRRAGLLAAMLFSLQQANVLGNQEWSLGINLAMTEPWVLLFCLMAVLLALRISRAERVAPGWYVVYGGLSLVASLVRMNALILLALPLVWLRKDILAKKPIDLRPLALVALGFLLFLLPYSARNIATGYTPIPYMSKINMVFQEKLGINLKKEYRALVGLGSGTDKLLLKQSETEDKQAGSGDINLVQNISYWFSVLPNQARAPHKIGGSMWGAQVEENGPVTTQRFAATGMVLFSAVLVVIGQLRLWRSKGLVGWLPLLTSGLYIGMVLAGSEPNIRHSMPTQWSAILLLGFGVEGILARSDGIGSSPPRNVQLVSGWGWALVPLAAVVSLVFVVELFAVPVPSGMASGAEVSLDGSHTRQLEKVGLDVNQIKKVLAEDPSAVLLYGSSYYPYFVIGYGSFEDKELDFFRLETRVAVLGRIAKVTLPMGASPKKWQIGQPVIVLGCRDGVGVKVDAWGLVTMGEAGKLFSRQPAVPFACPLPQVTCPGGKMENCQLASP